MQGPKPPPATSAEERDQALLVGAGGPHERLLLAVMAECGWDAMQAASGADALEAMHRDPIDVVLLDLDLPDEKGLTVLDRMRADFPEAPVVIVADPEDAGRLDAAMDLGAANFLCKPLRKREVGFVLDRLRRALEKEDDIADAMDAIIERRTTLEMPCDPAAIPRIVSLLGREVRCHYPGYRLPLPDLKLALYEALANAVEHGSLEIDFDGEAEAMIDPGGLARLIESRRSNPRLAARRIRIDVRYGGGSVEYRVRDEGGGFDPDARCPERALGDANALQGRGLALIRHYMTGVSWNPAGNEIRMVRRVGDRRPRKP